MLSITDKNLGTPEARSSRVVTLEIDGFQVTAPEGTSVLRAAATIDIAIPKFCFNSPSMH